MDFQSANNTISKQQIGALQRTLKGNVLLPCATTYEEKRKSWNLLDNQQPVIIVEVQSVNDIVEVIRFANSQDLPIRVQSTGHGALESYEGHILIRTGLLNDITVNVEDLTVRIGAGVIWADVVKAIGNSGIAPLSGFAPSVGVIGYTLGGGFGWLVRKYGIAADSVLSIDMVTMNGDILKVSAQSDPELFSGICGGGINLGIITAVELMLFPLGSVQGGKLFFRLVKLMLFYRPTGNGQKT